jgi:hypothetical protein
MSIPPLSAARRSFRGKPRSTPTPTAADPSGGAVPTLFRHSHL